MVKTYELFAGVLNRFECDIDHLKQTEWPALKVRMKRDNNSSVQDFYHRLFTIPNQKETLKNILVLAEIILCIPVSSDICERGFFFAMARLNSDWRSRLTPDMLNFLMAISIQGPEPMDYNAARALSLWWHGGERARRP